MPVMESKNKNKQRLHIRTIKFNTNNNTYVKTFRTTNNNVINNVDYDIFLFD